jgi:hypothetical protein
VRVPTCLFHNRGVFLLLNSLQAESYLKCLDDFRNAFTKFEVPDKPTVFRLIACFREKGIVKDRKLSGRPAVLNDVSMENIRHSLVQSPRKSFIYNILRYVLNFIF